MSRSSTASSTALTDRGECHGRNGIRWHVAGEVTGVATRTGSQGVHHRNPGQPDAADAEPEIGEVTAAAQTLDQRRRCHRDRLRDSSRATLNRSESSPAAGCLACSDQPLGRSDPSASI
jgi:hypothetical protein